uniref:Uncharacterized protein n=1 Tax=Melopsittacus undulatus TaxID=13146 RepID=A0A8V5FIE7_MELUD
MVICCAAANCSNRQGKAHRGAVSFHRFPLKDSKRLIQWLKAVQRDNWTPTKYSFLCSEHFTKDSFSKRLEDQHRFTCWDLTSFGVCLWIFLVCK